jgi:hypothetical protein
MFTVEGVNDDKYQGDIWSGGCPNQIKQNIPGLKQDMVPRSVEAVGFLDSAFNEVERKVS